MRHGLTSAVLSILTIDGRQFARLSKGAEIMVISFDILLVNLVVNALCG